jgi:hypothetical protein
MRGQVGQGNLGAELGNRNADDGDVFMRLMTSRPNMSSSAYVYLPWKSEFYVHPCLNTPAVVCRDKITRGGIWLTQDGWIYQDWIVLLPWSMDMSGQGQAEGIRSGHDGIWCYNYNGQTYPLLCRPVNWPELELLHTFV